MEEVWIIPCNIKHFDITEHLKTSSTLVWRNSFSIHAGDVAYIYLSAPFSEIKYRCKVVSEEVDDELLQKNAYAIPQKPSHNFYSKKLKYIVMELEQEYPSGTFQLTELKKHGLGQVQIQARADRSLRKYLRDVDAQI